MLKIFLLNFLLLIIIGSNISVLAQNINYELVEINFDGNDNISDSELKEVILSRETPMWLLKFMNSIYSKIGREPSYFDSTRIQNDLRSLENYYNDNGYFEAKFSADYKLDGDDKEAVLNFYVVEGPPFLLSSFKVTGLQRLSKRVGSEAASIMERIDTTQVYSRSRIENVRQSLLTLFLDRGFMLANTAQRDVFIDTTTNKVGVAIDYNTGLRYRLSEIRVEKSGPGSEFVEDTLIKSLAGLQTEAYYGLGETRTAQIRLVRTNLFSSVLVSPVINDTTSNRVPIAIVAEIGKLHELSPEIIVNEQEGALNVGLGGNYLKKNFLGDARSLNIKGSAAIQDIFRVNYSNITKFLGAQDTTIKGYLDSRVIVSQPFLFNKRILSTLDAYYTINKLKEYRSQVYGGRISFDFELPKIVYLNFLQAFYYVENSRYDFSSDHIRTRLGDLGYTRSVVDSILPFISEFSTLSSIIGTEFGADKTNNVLFPTNGYRISITFEEANSVPYLLSKLGFNKLEPETQFYRIMTDLAAFPKIYKNINNAFGLKFRLGYIKAYKGSNDDLPLNKRFTAGGSNSVRGWSSRELVPTTETDLSIVGREIILTNEQLKIGGTFLLEGSFETRNRLLGGLGTALFLDYGNTWNSNNINLRKTAIAFGFGIRYYSSFAPIRFDIGFKAYDPYTRKNLYSTLNKQRFWDMFADIIAIHLGLGEAF